MATESDKPKGRKRVMLKEITHQGMKVALDRPQGSTRTVTTPEGTELTILQRCDYGYLPMSLGDDGEEYDAYVGPNPMSPRVRIVVQRKPVSRTYDEQKAMLGMNTDEEAREVYGQHTHPKMFLRMGSLTIDDFKRQMADAGGDLMRVETDEDKAERGALLALEEPGLDPYAVMRSGMTRGDADPRTNFPSEGQNKAVSFQNSKYRRFDLGYAEGCLEKAPDIFFTGSAEPHAPQFAILCRIARMGGVPKSRAEILAVRMREAWGDQHAAGQDLPAVCAQMRWCMVGKMGEEAMKGAVEKARDPSLAEIEGATAAPLSSTSAVASTPAASVDKPLPSSSTTGTKPGAAPGTPPAAKEPLDPVPSSSSPVGHPPSTPRPTSSNSSGVARTPRISPQAKVPAGHRSEAAADPGPLSRRSPAASPPLPPSPPAGSKMEPTHVRSLDALLQRFALLALAAPADGDPELDRAQRFAARQLLGGRGAPGAPGVQGRAAQGGGDAGSAAGGANDDGRRRHMSIALDAATVEDEALSCWFIASTEAVDSYGEIVDQSEWDFERFKLNPVILFAHKSSELPIGRAAEWKVQDKRLLIKVRFSRVNPFAVLVWGMIKEGMLRAGSVGFLPGETKYMDDGSGGRRLVLYKNKLFEFSVCPVPANEEAVTLSDERMVRALENVEKALATIFARDAGDTTPRAALPPPAPPPIVTLGVVPFHAYPISQSMKWDATAAEKRIRAWATVGEGEDAHVDMKKYALAFAWFDAKKPDDFGSYKLPHHDIMGGKMVTVRAGVIAAGNSIMGSHGNPPNIPAADLPAVKKHLESEYHLFGIKAPWEPKGDKKNISPGSTDTMRLKTLEPSDVHTIRSGGKLEVECENCHEPHRVDMGPVQKAISETEARAKTAEASAEEHKTKATAAETRAKEAEKTATDLLAKLTRLELTPLIGVDPFMLSASDAETLAVLRTVSPDLYEKQLKSAVDRFERGVKKAEEDEAARAKAKKDEEAEDEEDEEDEEKDEDEDEESDKGKKGGKKDGRTPITRSSDPTPVTGAASTSDLKSAMAGLQKRAKQLRAS